MTLGRLFDEPLRPGVRATSGFFLWLLPIEEADPKLALGW